MQAPLGIANEAYATSPATPPRHLRSFFLILLLLPHLPPSSSSAGTTKVAAAAAAAVAAAAVVRGEDNDYRQWNVALRNGSTYQLFKRTPRRIQSLQQRQQHQRQLDDGGDDDDSVGHEGGGSHTAAISSCLVGFLS